MNEHTPTSDKTRCPLPADAGEPRCKSCGVAWADHPGLMATCAALAERTRERDQLQKQLAAAQREKGRAELKHHQRMNLVVGVATNLMCAVGLDWKGRVARLCNFAGEFDEIERAWRDAHVEASERIHQVREQVEEIAGFAMSQPECPTDSPVVGQPTEAVIAIVNTLRARAEAAQQDNAALREQLEAASKTAGIEKGRAEAAEQQLQAMQEALASANALVERLDLSRPNGMNSVDILGWEIESLRKMLDCGHSKNPDKKCPLKIPCAACRQDFLEACCEYEVARAEAAEQQLQKMREAKR